MTLNQRIKKSAIILNVFVVKLVTTYRVFGISTSNDKGKIFQFLIKDVQILDIYFLFQKGEMAKVVPLLRALNAMIIQYRNRVVRVNKNGPQLMTRLRVLF